MKKALFIIAATVVFSCSTSTKPLTTATVEKIVGDLHFTEGPALAKNGDIYFSDIPKNQILIWTTENNLDTFRENSGGANGLFFDKNQNLIMCEGDSGRITMISKEGEYSILTKSFDNKRYNRPNDLWPDSKGGIYFTDPFYGTEEAQSLLEMDGMNVYYIKPDRKTVIKVVDDFQKPNGIIGTPDGKTLYITDAQGGITWKYAINEDGTLSNKQEFAPIGCDGMTLDSQGNVYLTNGKTSSVDIYSPEGILLQSIPVPEKPSNVCFGKDETRLFITARTSLYAIDMTNEGVEETMIGVETITR